MMNLLSKRILTLTSMILALSAGTCFAGVNVNINLGAPVHDVVVAPAPPVYAVPPVYAPPVETVRVESDVQFVYPDALGFYVAVGVPYDLFYVQNSYYLVRDGRWLRAPSCRGPWVVQRQRELPQALRRHRIERIREYRNREYTVYNRDPDHYRGKHFRSPREEWKEQHKEAKRLRHEERQLEKEQRKEEKRYEKEQRKEDKRYEKEERKEAKRWEKEERREHRERHGD